MADRRSFLTAAGLTAITAGGALSASGCSQPQQVGTQAAPTASVPAKDVPVGGGTIMSQGRYVVTQPEAGTYRAFSKSCPHAACPVTEISGGEIICKCHNSRFKVEDGSRILGPATRGLTPAKAELQGDQVVITPQ